MEIINENTIKLGRELSDLDLLVLEFVKILQKYAEYILVSGYVAILFGRSRTTEDVDMFVKKIPKDKFLSFYQELLDNDFWSLNADSGDELFSLLEDNLAVRFARKGKVSPNFEMKWPKDSFDELAFKEKVKVLTSGGELFISPIEMQIAYKRFVLQSQKDLEDAQHLQSVFEIPNEKINKYKPLFRWYGKI